MPILIVVIASALAGLVAYLPVPLQPHPLLLGEAAYRFDWPLVAPVPLLPWALCAAYLGIAAAGVLYRLFDVADMAVGLRQLLLPKKGDDRQKRALLGLVVVGAVAPTVAFLVLRWQGIGGVSLVLSPEWICWVAIGGGVLLLAIDASAMTISKVRHLGVGAGFLIGLLQIAAWWPGVGRATTVVLGARFLGLERQEAARLSVLFGIPAALGIGIALAWELTLQGTERPPLPEAGAAFGAGFGAALLSMAFMGAWVERGSFALFAVWRILAGAIGLWIVYDIGLPF